MIWLANYNAGPISYNYGATGAPTPVASNVALGGYTWNLYYGSNGYNYVYSFLPVSGTIPSFSADINLFLKVRSLSFPLPSQSAHTRHSTSRRTRSCRHRST
jgi:xyloglucan-specific endo-beta-1,4-glucanase